MTEYASDLQKLLEKAFGCHDMDPTLKDQILLGQFEQGLLVKRKRELKYPIDTFEDALQQARVAEAVEVQLIPVKAQPPANPCTC